jgi:hypothetical protein
MVPGGTVKEIVVRSAAPGPLALPWELLQEPDRPPVALDRVAVTRSLSTAALAQTFTVAGDRLRVLMVISRPGGDKDVGHRMIAWSPIRCGCRRGWCPSWRTSPRTTGRSAATAVDDPSRAAAGDPVVDDRRA